MIIFVFTLKVDCKLTKNKRRDIKLKSIQKPLSDYFKVSDLMQSDGLPGQAITNCHYMICFEYRQVFVPY